MLSMKKTGTSLIPVRLGGLLIAAGIIRPDHMAVALSKARQSSARIGQVLIATSMVTENDLTCALELQQLIKSGSITVELGAHALRRVHEERVTVHKALSDLGWTDENAIKTTDLASLLLDAGVISKAQLEQGSWNSAKNSLPLGRNLVLAGALSPSLLGAVLNALVLIRDRAASRDQVIHGLRAAHQNKVPFEETVHQAAALSQNHVRVGELLSSAGLLSDSDAMIAVENGLLNGKSIGQVLLQARMVSPLVLDACLKLQKMILDGSMTRVQAAELLRQVASKQVGLEQFLKEMTYLKSRVVELLLRSEVITQGQLESAIAVSPESQEDMVRALFVYGVLTQDMFRTAVRCVYAIDEGQYTAEEMVHVLKGQFRPLMQESA